MTNTNFTPWLGVDENPNIQAGYDPKAFQDGEAIVAKRFNAALRMSSLVAAAIVESQGITGDISQSLNDIADQLKADLTSAQINTNKLKLNDFTKTGFEDASIANDTAIFLLPRFAYSTDSVEDRKFIQDDPEIYYAQVLSYIYKNYIKDQDLSWQTAIFIGATNPANLELMLIYTYPYAGTNGVTVQGINGHTLENVILPAYSTGLILSYYEGNVRTFGTISEPGNTNTKYFYYHGIKLNTLQPGNTAATIGSSTDKFDTIYANNFNGNLTGTATSAGHATSADTATSAVHATSADTATSAESANSATTSSFLDVVSNNEIRFKRPSSWVGKKSLNIGYRWAGEGETDNLIEKYIFQNGNGALADVEFKSATGNLNGNADTATASDKIKIGTTAYTLSLSGTTLTLTAG